MKLSGPLVLIDDDPDDMGLLLDVLKRIGVEGPFRLFDDCSDAMEYLKSTTEDPFLIICDVNLPVMSGLEFRRAINSDDYLRKKSIPFVFLSTAAMKAQVLEAYDLTVQGYFVKPFTMSEMEKTLTSILNYWYHCVHPNSIK